MGQWLDRFPFGPQNVVAKSPHVLLVSFPWLGLYNQTSHLLPCYSPECRFALSKCGSKNPGFDLPLSSLLSTRSRLCSHELGTRAIYTHARVYHMANVLSATGWRVRGVWGCSRCFRLLAILPLPQARTCGYQVALE